MKDIKDKSLPILFVTSFVQAVLNKIDEYKKQTAVLSKSVYKEHSVLEGAGAVGGAGFNLLSPIPGSIFAFKEMGSKIARYSYNKRHKEKAKTVLHRLEDNVARHLYQPSESQIFKQMVSILIEGGLEVFRSFEYQLNLIWIEEDPPVRRNMQKVAADAADRFIDYLHLGPIDEREQVNYKTVVKGVLIGKSKSPFGLTLSKNPFKKTGRSIDSKAEWNTSDLFVLTKVAVTGRDVKEENGIYVKTGKATESEKYGVRPTTAVENEEFEQFFLTGNYKRQEGTLKEICNGYTPSTEEELSEVSEVVQKNVEKMNMHTLAAKQKGCERDDLLTCRILVPVLPKPDSKCVKRTDLMNEALAVICLEDNPPPILVLYGFGGFGKTQLAKNVLDKVEKEFDVCVWINNETAASDVQTILQLNQVPFQTESSWKVLFTLLQNLLKGKKVLLVFDNITSEKELIEYLSISGSARSMCRDFTVMVTSRKEMKFELPGIKNIYNIGVASLKEEEAEEFAKSMLTDEISGSNKKDFKELIKLSGGIPLALATMCATIRWMNLHSRYYSLGSYLEDFKSTEIGNSIFFYGEKEDDPLQLDYKQSLRLSMDVAVTQIRKQEHIGPLAIEILNKIVYGPLVRIDLFTDIFNSMPSVRESVQIIMKQPKYTGFMYFEIIQEAILLLGQFRVIDIDQSMNCDVIPMFRMNSILAAVRRHQLQLENREEEILMEILESLSKVENGRFKEHSVACSAWMHASRYPEICRDFFLEKGSLFDLAEEGSPLFLKELIDILGPVKAVTEILRQHQVLWWFTTNSLMQATMFENLPVVELYCNTIMHCQSIDSIDEVERVFGELVCSAAAAHYNQELFSKIMHCFGPHVGDTSVLCAELSEGGTKLKTDLWNRNRVATYILEIKIDIPWSFDLAVYASVLSPDLFVKYCEQNKVNAGAVARIRDQVTLFSAVKDIGCHPDVIKYILPKLDEKVLLQELQESKDKSPENDKQ